MCASSFHLTKKAVHWLSLLAEEGDLDAQNTLGEAALFEAKERRGKKQLLPPEVLYTGQGVERDEKTAVRWFTEAATNGHEEAQYWVGVDLLDKGRAQAARGPRLTAARWRESA